MSVSSRRLRIVFLTTVGRNVGDEFIREGIRSFFDALLGPTGYDAYHVCKHDLATLSTRVYDEPEMLADKFRDADVIVQAGAPVYWNNGKHKSHNADWAQPLWFDRIFPLGRTKLILNLGAGAGQKDEGDLDTLLADRGLIDFARRAGQACAWTSVRDPLAAAFLDAINVSCDLLPCPAFHAARRASGPGTLPPAADDGLAVNFMELAGHFRLKPSTDAAKWRNVIDELLPRLRLRHKLLFVAHDQAEADFQKTLATPGEDVFVSADYREYLKLYARVKGIVANRVHGAVTVAGFGRPAVIVGNDCRIGIARPIGLPACDSAEATANWIVSALADQMDERETLNSERMALRESSAEQYTTKLRGLLVARFGKPTVRRAA
jgi:hypothetical protein